MLRSAKTAALSLSCFALAALLHAQSTPGPPDWNDASASVYEQFQQGNSTNAAAEPQAPVAVETPNLPAASIATPLFHDTAVAQAVHRASVPATADQRRHLAPPSSGRTLSGGGGEAGETNDRSPRGTGRLSNFGVPLHTVYTILSALTVVLGAFLIFAWAMRRGARKSTTVLPSEVVSFLGRVPLPARQFAELLRVGNKLVLVSLTPTGPETITEVTDPVEVDRLVGLCQQYNPHSTTKAFEQVFRQLSHDTTRHGFLDGDALPASLSAADAYRANRGDTARA